ncbi:MAG: trigger factor [Bacilli bacterium]|nr:trigger factor [Bacilli bacterium]
MDNKHELIIKVEGKEWQEALNKSFEKNVKKAKIDGFREGKVPRNIYETKYGKESLYNDAVDNILPKAYEKAIMDSKLVPIFQPSLEIVNIDENGVEIKLVVTTKPKIKIKKYKGLKVPKEKIEVKKEEVEEAIKELQKQYSEIVVKDGKIEKGDTAVIDFEGFKDNKVFEGGTGENYPLEIGSNTFIPGFEDQLIGLSVNDKKDVEVTFPEEYPSEDLKGQKVIFKVKINEIKTKSVPELNEDFFKDLGRENVSKKEDLFKSLEKELKAAKEVTAENKYIDSVLEAISKHVEVDIPDEMVDEEVHRMIHQYEDKLKMQGITLDQYLQFTGGSQEQLHTQLEEEAGKVVLYRLMIEEISLIEKIDVTDKEEKEELTKMAEKHQMSETDLLNALGGKEMIKYDIKMRKTLEFLKNNN